MDTFELKTIPALKELSVAYTDFCPSCSTVDIKAVSRNESGNFSIFQLARNRGSTVFVDSWDEAWSKTCANFTIGDVGPRLRTVTVDMVEKCDVLERVYMPPTAFYLPVVLQFLVILVLFSISFFTKFFVRVRQHNMTSQRRSQTHSQGILEDEDCLIQSDNEAPQVSSRVRQRSASTISTISGESCPPAPQSRVTDSRDTNSLISGSATQSERIQQISESSSNRLKSLDAFRGLAIISMIYCDYGGGGYAPFRHAVWDGITYADFVFPWFVFSMGTSVVLARDKSLYRIFVRSAKLMAAGVLLINGSKDFSSLRIPGVLQRLGFTYFVIAVLEKYGVPPSSGDLRRSIDEPQRNLFADFKNQGIKWILIAIVQILWFLITYIPKIPGCPRGYIGPGGISDHSQNYNCTGGISRIIDSAIFGEDHLYKWSAVSRTYFPPEDQQLLRWDPEGILGTLNVIVLAFLGAQLGKIVKLFSTPMGILCRFLAWAVLLLVITAVLDYVAGVPVNKNIWTPSYTTLTAATAFFVIAAFYQMIDIFRGKIILNGQVNLKLDLYPLACCGKNPLFIYIGHHLMAGRIPFVLGLDASQYWAKTLENFVGTAIWVAIAIYLDKKKWYLRI